MKNEFEIVEYGISNHSKLLQLLVELHSTYFFQTAVKEHQELQKEIDLVASYEAYLLYIEGISDETWKIFLAKSAANQTVGFIIGSIEIDEALVFDKIGKFEDWFVEEKFRRRGIGLKLYEKLEKWFVKNGCKQVRSDTWAGNDLSIAAHKHLGFFVSGVNFGKKL